jgi:hypothetical protein
VDGIKSRLDGKGTHSSRHFGLHGGWLAGEFYPESLKPTMQIKIVSQRREQVKRVYPRNRFSVQEGN